MSMSFEVSARDGAARTGRLTLAHGDVETPVFMPVGTYGTVKAMAPDELAELGARIILGNTFHLWLRPGLDVIVEHQGLHRFMGWTRPLLTDSGGFQVFSLGKLRTISEDGVQFASPINGDRLFLTPEESMRIQHALNSDIAMVFDECTPYQIDDRVATQSEAADSMRLSLRWAQRSATEFNRLRTSNGLFGIVQGGMFETLRDESLAALVDMDFDGFAIGGLSVGEPKEEMMRILAYTAPKMPTDKPRYLMGVGTPEDLIDAIGAGIDMFDCVLPTRSGRTGQAFTWDGPINIRNAKFAEDQEPIDPESPVAGWSKAYIHHLVRSGEILGAMLMTEHNLWFYQRLMQGLREAITERRLEAFAADFLARYCSSLRA